MKGEREIGGRETEVVQFPVSLRPISLSPQIQGESLSIFQSPFSNKE
jgi:hypothetical protein